MRIEVIAPQDTSGKIKGDLLESLIGDFMRIQGFDVTSQVRVTGCELDLLCKHRVSGKTIYVECKAHRDPLSANIFKNLLGTIDFKEYSEGWLISTGPLGKDASGFMTEWEDKPREKREKMSIYHPDRVIQSLISAAIIKNQPEIEAGQLINEGMSIGEWTLIISRYGRFWACPILEAGVPTSVLLFDATTALSINDDDLLASIRATDTSLSELKFVSTPNIKKTQPLEELVDSPAVIEIECGDKWIDYRPARPEHFVGRSRAQRDLLQFFSNIKKKRTESRIFAIKGDSGIGKSSLLAKLRASANISKKPNNLFLYAVDVRAASNSAYVYASLIAALKNAATNGFSSGRGTELQVSNYADPLQSHSIRNFLSECEKKHELVILVFDQFEELYSKPELFPVFDEVRKLMFSTLASSTNFALGFAWKTDSTVPQDHPAYYMWHQLSDHRYEIFLKPFTHADADNSVRLFETELGTKIRPELRRYLIENSQGYPWLLKKLCIHLYEQLDTGASQSLIAERTLDVSSLFDRDLSDLTQPQMACLKLVAEHAPMDWYEVLETTGADVVQSLQQKRLLIRRGDKLNLYWDIFRDYVLSRNIPSIPFTYIPQAPSIGALIRLALQLDPLEPNDLSTLSEAAAISESTARNIVHDLEQFGIADIDGDRVLLDSHMGELTSRAFLSRIRLVFRRHGLTTLLKENNSKKAADQAQIVQYLKQLNPAAQHHSRTWKTYASRMCHWLNTLGLVERQGTGLIFFDHGDIITDETLRFGGERKRVVFIGDAPPSRVIEALDYFVSNGPQSILRMKSLGFRNACAVLYRFRLIEITPAHEYQIVKRDSSGFAPDEAVWDEAMKEDALQDVADLLKSKPTASASEIGARSPNSLKGIGQKPLASEWGIAFDNGQSGYWHQGQKMEDCQNRLDVNRITNNLMRKS